MSSKNDTIEKFDEYGRNSTEVKRIRAENKQTKRNSRLDEHINLSNRGVPRRNTRWNKLGLKKRSEYADYYLMEETNFPYDEIEFAENNASHYEFANEN